MMKTRVMKRRLPVLFLLLLCLLTGCDTFDASPGVTPTALPPPSVAPAPTPSPSPTPAPIEVRLQMVGDVLLHTKPMQAAKTGDNTYDFTSYFSQIAPYLDGDLVICNMEGPIDAKGGNQGISSYPTFNAPYEIAEAVRGAGFNFALTANNHAFDKGLSGLIATRGSLTRAGLPFTGTYETKEQFDAECILDVNGLQIGVLNYTDSVNGLESLIPDDTRSHALRRFVSDTMDSLPAMSEDIRRLKDHGADFVLVALHWGAEYQDKPTQTQRDIAQGLCDAGADLILGGHAHTVQPVEWFDAADGRRCLIAYSMGNFFADQTALNPPIPRTQYGLLLSVTVIKTADGMSWGEADYMPTLALPYTDADGRRAYRVFPVPPGAGEGARPEGFPNDDIWTKAGRAYDHVVTTVGDAVPVWGQTG